MTYFQTKGTIIIYIQSTNIYHCVVFEVRDTAAIWKTVHQMNILCMYIFRVMVVCLQEKIAVLDALSLSKKFGITSEFNNNGIYEKNFPECLLVNWWNDAFNGCLSDCFPGLNINPVALSSRWLAFADRKVCFLKHYY